MRNWIFLGLALAAAALLVPFSSRRPDAVQSVLGLPGGVDSALKALGGILMAAVCVMILTSTLRKFKKRP